jgi:preprotein translocase subunit SecE
MARSARTRRQKREAAAAAEPQGSGVTERARERRRRAKPVGEPKTQTGQRRERRGGFTQFTRESAGELRKVDWPNQRQLFSASVVVIIAVAVVGLFLYVADEAFSRLVRDVLLDL